MPQQSREMNVYAWCSLLGCRIFFFRILGSIDSTPNPASAGTILLILLLPSDFLIGKGANFASSRQREHQEVTDFKRLLIELSVSPPFFDLFA
jgi:hypothetical protein